MTTISNNTDELHKCNIEQKKADTKDYVVMKTAA